MPAILATIFCIVAIGVLFTLDYDRTARTSKALWIPVVWLWIVGSRDVSQWLAEFGIGRAERLFERPEQYLEGNALDRVVYTGLVAVGLAVLISRGPAVLALLRSNLPILFFFGYCAFSTLWSDYSAVAFKRWAKAAGDIIMVMIVLSEPNRITAVKRFLARASFILIPVSVLLVKYYPNVGADFNFHHWNRVYTGVTTNKNFLGVICLLFGLASCWRVLMALNARPGKKRTAQLISHAVIVGLAIWLLWMANSMTSWACFVLAGMVMAATSLKNVRRNPRLLHAFVATAISVAVMTLFFDIGGGALESVGRDATLTGRTEIWNLALRLSENPWVGTGFESFWLGKRLETVWSIMPGIQEAHNGYLEVFLNLGWFGIGLLGVMLLKGYARIWQSYRRDPSISSLNMAFFTAAVVYNFTEAGFRMLNPIWSLFLLAVVCPEAKPTGCHRFVKIEPIKPFEAEALNLQYTAD